VVPNARRGSVLRSTTWCALGSGWCEGGLGGFGVRASPSPNLARSSYIRAPFEDVGFVASCPSRRFPGATRTTNLIPSPDTLRRTPTQCTLERTCGVGTRLERVDMRSPHSSIVLRYLLSLLPSSLHTLGISLRTCFTGSAGTELHTVHRRSHPTACGESVGLVEGATAGEVPARAHPR